MIGENSGRVRCLACGHVSENRRDHAVHLVDVEHDDVGEVWL